MKSVRFKSCYRIVFSIILITSAVTLNGCINKLYDFFHKDQPSVSSTQGLSETQLQQNNAPDKPAIIKPSDLQASNSGNPRITAGAFSDQDGNTHLQTDWEVYDKVAADDADKVWFKYWDNTNLVSITVNTSNGTFLNSLAGQTSLASGNWYWCRCRYYDQKGWYGEWSDLRKFRVTTAKLYITSSDNGTIQELDLASETVTNTTVTGGKPWGIDLSPDGTMAYVGNQGDNKFYSYDTATKATASNGNFISDPSGVEINTLIPGVINVIFVANRGNNSVSARNPADLDEVGLVIPMPPGCLPSDLVSTQDEVFMYIAGSGSNSVYKTNTLIRLVLATLAVGNNPVSLALNSADTKLYVSNQGDNTVSVVDTATFSVTSNINVGSGPGSLLITPDGKYLFVANTLDATVSVIDPATGTVTATIPVGTTPSSIVFSADSVFAYILNSSSDNITVIDTRSLALDHTISGVSKGSQMVIRN